MVSAGDRRRQVASAGLRQDGGLFSINRSRGIESLPRAMILLHLWAAAAQLYTEARQSHKLMAKFAEQSGWKAGGLEFWIRR